MKKNLLSHLFKSSKKKKSDDDTQVSEETYENNQENDVKDRQVIEYHETLYSDRPNTQSSTHPIHRKLLLNNVHTVESDIDSIGKEKHIENGNIEKKVDSVLEKKKSDELKPSTKRKPANVIYVVSKPQPGQVKGDWAVRSHHKIFSHHRTKQAAIKKARSVALEKDSTVLVQNTDGTFSNGFKPRKKNK